MKVKLVTKGIFDLIFNSKEYKDLKIESDEEFIIITNGYDLLHEVDISKIEKIIIT